MRWRLYRAVPRYVARATPPRVVREGSQAKVRSSLFARPTPFVRPSAAVRSLRSAFSPATYCSSGGLPRRLLAAVATVCGYPAPMRLNSCSLVFMAFRLDPFPRDPGQQLSMETAVAERLSAAAINFFVLLLHGCTSLRPACAWRGDWQACERVLRGARGQSCCPSGGCMRSCSAVWRRKTIHSKTILSHIHTRPAARNIGRLEAAQAGQKAGGGLHGHHAAALSTRTKVSVTTAN